ncbi:MAG: dTDP-4-dehydrorhamnose reductase [Flavobacteriaceae bacterium]|jgi:dTDP-4-dehydrorhamnose reductase|nr:dTDP-4-dehydrorhamnose reductase [Flavobacteriaceae bacterium]
MKKILITGGNGQLGQCFQKIAADYASDFEFNFTDFETLDITDKTAVFNFFENYIPDFCINAAAYTAVDLAETEIKKAYSVNADAAVNLAEACKKHSTLLIHISTDYVFDGDTEIPYDENSTTNPIGIYGKSKRKGEELVLEINLKTIVLRTSWLYSEFGKNFVKSMLNLFSQKEELGIVADQFGQPTNANDLAQAVMNIIKSDKKEFGIFHFSNYPETTWFDFAKKIAEFSQSPIKLKAITTEQFPTPAKRPKRSTLSLEKIKSVYNITPKRWENSFKECLENMKNQRES